FARHYALLARLASDDLPAATVEARRLSALLETFAPDLDASERATHAALRDVAGAVFEAAGEWNDAGVAYRNAALLRGVPRSLLDSLVVEAPGADSATLVLVVEEGFAAHYVARSVALPFDGSPAPSRRARDRRIGSLPGPVPSPRAGVDARPTPDGAPPRTPASVPTVTPPDAVPVVDGGTSVGPGWSPPVALQDSVPHTASGPRLERLEHVERASPDLATRWMSALARLPGGGVYDDAAWDAATAPAMPRTRESVALDWTPRGTASTRYLGSRGTRGDWLRVAWPMLVRARVPSAPVALSLDGIDDVTALRRATLRPTTGASGALPPFTAAALLEAGGLVSDAMGADARRRLPGQLARLAARVATRSAVAEVAREELGDAAGFAVQLMASALDRPDTRGWHLLPGRVRVLRFTVPAGLVRPALRQGAGANALQHELAPFEAAPGSVTVRTLRLWRDPIGGPVPVARVGGPDTTGTPTPPRSAIETINGQRAPSALPRG
ncbi:MAG TPA: hypothetical protein PKE51_14025, partial [Gemmatimonadaceae bacterium]|nr:hypothetical protein [Gemmatimonadaceae bacterium]